MTFAQILRKLTVRKIWETAMVAELRAPDTDLADCGCGPSERAALACSSLGFQRSSR
jgi:hypothetical protein